MSSVRVMCLGDVVGRPGREMLATHLPELKAHYRVHLVVVNGENAAGGLGIDPATARELREAGADVLTLGDHTFHKREMRDFLDREGGWCIRPGNYREGAPGRGATVVECTADDGSQVKVGVANVMGRVFSNLLLDDPFHCFEGMLRGALAPASVRICDMHAEATSEKSAFARLFDGRISAVVGTHTHVQTADERVLGGGTAFITDLGMCGPHDGVIGMDGEVAIGRFITGLPAAYKLAPARSVVLSGAVIECDCATGHARSIERVARIYERE